jgi:hypothetical protein
MKAPLFGVVSGPRRSAAPLFGVGLPTPPARLTEGLPRSSQALASKAFVLAEHTPTEGDLRSGTRAGSGDPRTT